MSNYQEFDRSKLVMRPLSERVDDFDLSRVTDPTPQESVHPNLAKVAEHIVEAKRRGSSIMLMLGAHVLRSGVQRYLIDLLERGFFTCLSVNGAVAIHDFELALTGSTTESVGRYIRSGDFGMWSETSRINTIVSNASETGLGLGEAIGRVIETERFPHRDVSILANAYRLKIPLTVHVSIGYDIVHEHPNCDGAAWGRASYRDFLIYARCLEGLEGGVVMNFGSAIMAPEVFLKALAMVRNVASREGRSISNFTSLVCDLRDLPERIDKEAPKDTCDYYFRPWKTMLVRTVADGGRSFYVKGFHKDTIPQLWTALVSEGQPG
jgi:hypothetical protein